MSSVTLISHNSLISHVVDLFLCIQAPEFNKLDDAQNMNVSESAAVGTVVFTFDVQDKDELPNPLQITILSESQPNVFEVNGTTLVTKSELDMEDVQSYSLTFQLVLVFISTI